MHSYNLLHNQSIISIVLFKNHELLNDSTQQHLHYKKTIESFKNVQLLNLKKIYKYHRNEINKKIIEIKIKQIIIDDLNLVKTV